MSAHYVTVKELIEQLSKHHGDTLVTTIWPGEEEEWSCEGSIEGVSLVESVEIYEVRSGWILRDENIHDPNDCVKALVLSGVGVQWLDD